MISRRIAEALADGEEVSWRDASRLADTPRERQAVADLRWIKSVSPPAGRVSGHAPAHLPLWASVATWVAVVRIGAAALAVAFGRIAHSRFTLAQILLVVSFVAAATILLRGGRSDLRARWLGVVYLLTAIAFAHPFLLSGGWFGTLFRLPVEALIPAALWRFAEVFPNSERFSPFDRAARIGAATALSAGLTLVAVNIALLGSGTLAGTRVALLDRDHAGWAFWAIVYPLALPALILPVARAYAASRLERGRVRLFTAALTVGMTPIIVSGLIEQFAPGVASIWTSSATGTAIVDALVLGALLIVPPATTYAVLTRQALSVRLVLERATRYLLARSTLTLLTVVPAGLLGWFLFEHRDQPLAVVLSGGRGRATAVWFIASVLMLLARQQLLVLVDHAFQSRPRDHGQALGDAIAALRGAAGVTPLMGILADQINRVFGSRVAALRIDEHGDAVPLYGKVANLRGTSGIVTVALDSRDPLCFHGCDEILHLLPPDDRVWAADNDVEVVIALNRADGSPLALLVVGPRRDLFQWTDRDLSWLKAVGDAAALALDNACRHLEVAAAEADAWNASECRGCGAMQPTPVSVCACGGELQPSLLPPTLHGKFAVERRIGRGGMGVVYQGRDLALQRPVALKTLPQLDPDAARQMRREARAMGTILHPNLATIFGFELWQRTPVLVIELLDSQTLANRLRRDGPLPAADAVRLCSSLADALSALHGAGLLHGDVKPSNIGFTSGGTPKLLDFGLAAVTAPGTSKERGLLAGTPQYLPPEAFDGTPASAAFDLWALSVVLFEAIAGMNPFGGPTLAAVKQRVRSERPPQLCEWRADAPELLARTLETLLDPRPDRRPPSAGAWLGAIAAADPHRLWRSA